MLRLSVLVLCPTGVLAQTQASGAGGNWPIDWLLLFGVVATLLALLWFVYALGNSWGTRQPRG